ncbi:cuticlin-4 isoform X2 [Ischnura elegans]|nr:cuticlin-4 isoform X2 [Ischnura elegans]XP_046399229.1 cuticlin-4 isoform X2 [Ischnura elegans]
MARTMQRPTSNLLTVVVTLLLTTSIAYGAQIPAKFAVSDGDAEGRRLHYRTPSSPFPGHPDDEIEFAGLPSDEAPAPPPQEVRIECNNDEIKVAIRPAAGRKFDGMVYPKGLSKNSSCLAEFLAETPPIKYVLPLRSCNTMSTDLSDGGVEYFNTIVVQPHRKLVTNQGRGYHIRCRYQTKDKTILSHFNVSMLGTTPISATAPMPGCSMKIFAGDPETRRIAENVKIGDPLSLVISIEDEEEEVEEEQAAGEEDSMSTALKSNDVGSEEEDSSIPAYGIWVTDCLVRDGLGWGEQKLIDSDGCPLDGEIMGQFVYNAAKTTAYVRFQAHKFPYTASVYYQCNVRLCIKSGGGCADVPPRCDTSRNRREAVPQVEGATSDIGKDDGSSPATIEVYSGLYVNEATDAGGRGGLDPAASDSGVAKEKTPDDPDSICISQRSFAIGIAIAGLLLMLAVLAAVLIIVTRRRRRGRRRGKAGESTIGGSGSSIYSGPYTNTAYSHSS